MAITWLTERGAKTLRSVAAFLCGAEWITKCSEVNVQDKVWKKSSNYGLWNVVRVWFFLKNCCNHGSKRIEAVRSHLYTCSCGSSNERVCNRSVRTTLTTEPSCASVFDRTEERITILTWTIISMQLTETRLRKWGTLEFTILLFFKMQTTKRRCSQFRARGRNGKSISQTTVKAIQRILHGIRFVSGHLELLEHRESYIEYR